MHYTNTHVRRQDRILDYTAACALLSHGEYCVLSTRSDFGAYGVPLNYVWDGNQNIYIHCAPEGEKLRYIDASNSVSFCVVGKTNVAPAQFTTEYESVILQCVASRNLHEKERMHALQLLVQKYAPDYLEKGFSYAQASFHRTEVIKLSITQGSGKTKILSKHD